MKSAGAHLASDKHYWHRYSDFYDRHFGALEGVADVLEFGVLDGDSIRWLHQRFPTARIAGIDILAAKTQWPRDDLIEYVKVDQGHRSAIAGMFDKLDRTYDLMIEDGSHIPEHQASCLVLGLQRLRRGGLYVLEDIHTSHPTHAYSAKHPRGTPNCLVVLLAIQHLKETGRAATRPFAERLAHPKFFSADEILRLVGQIDHLELFKRGCLPLRCHACKSSDFDYARYRCKCGAEIFADNDSMAFAIVRA